MLKAEQKNVLFEKMQKIVDKKVKFYKSDFETDKAYISQKKNNLPMVWLVRESGTLLVSFYGAEAKTAQEVKQYEKDAIFYLEYYIKNYGPNVNLYIVDGENLRGVRLWNYEKIYKVIHENAAKLLTDILIKSAA